MHTLAVQQQQCERLVLERAAFPVRGVEADDLVRAHEPGVHRRPSLLADVDEEGRCVRRAVRSAVGVGADEQLDDRPLQVQRQ